ncbi:MAG: hypothetical protein WCZ87_01690 [Thiohalobacteraceae bacterium]
MKLDGEGSTEQVVETQLADFKAELAASGADYQCLTALDGHAVRLRFIGHFRGREVVWNAELLALGEDAATQFIEIGAPGPQGVALRVGLRGDRIDRPTLLKTLIMVRNYKRLRPGRHLFSA